MEFIGIFFALFYAMVLTALFSFVFKNTGPWSGSWVFFSLLFLVSLGAGEWAEQAGPSAWGYYWAPGLFAAIILALVLASTFPFLRFAGSKRKNIQKRPWHCRSLRRCLW